MFTVGLWQNLTFISSMFNQSPLTCLCLYGPCGCDVITTALPLILSSGSCESDGYRNCQTGVQTPPTRWATGIRQYSNSADSMSVVLSNDNVYIRNVREKKKAFFMNFFPLISTNIQTSVKNDISSLQYMITWLTHIIMNHQNLLYKTI